MPRVGFLENVLVFSTFIALSALGLALIFTLHNKSCTFWMLVTTRLKIEGSFSVLFLEKKCNDILSAPT